MTSKSVVDRRLAAVHLAEAELDISTKAAEAARAYVAEVQAEVASHVKKNEAASVKRAASLAQSLRVGKSTGFPDVPYVAIDHTARRSAEERLAVARRVGRGTERGSAACR
jgi:hypothetical protein